MTTHAASQRLQIIRGRFSERRSRRESGGRRISTRRSIKCSSKPLIGRLRKKPSARTTLSTKKDRRFRKFAGSLCKGGRRCRRETTTSSMLRSDPIKMQGVGTEVKVYACQLPDAPARGLAGASTPKGVAASDHVLPTT